MTCLPSSRRRRAQRGMGLFDALVALALLAFGMLAMSRFQTRLLAMGTEAQSRLVATQISDELISRALVDPGNPGCYTVPAEGACTSAAARTLTNQWASAASAALPGTVTATSTFSAATGQLAVDIAWTGKESGEQRLVRSISDVR